MIYKYTAVDIKGCKICGEAEAENREELWKNLRLSEYYLTECKKTKKVNINFHFKRVSAKDIAVFCNEFYICLEAGINIEKALTLLAEQSTNIRIKKSLNCIKNSIQKGDSLHESLKKFPQVYPRFLINMMFIGEESGKLDIILKKLALYYEKEYRYHKKIINSMIYPITVFITAIIAGVFLMLKVIPVFTEILYSINAEIPKTTEIILFLSSFIISQKYKLLTGSLVFIIVLKYFYKSPKGVVVCSKLKLKFPLVKVIYKHSIAEKISRSMGLLLNSGVNLIKALEITYSIIDNTVIKSKFRECIIDIKTGKSLYKSIDKLRIFNKLTISMLNVGEETGRLDEMFIKSAEIYEAAIYDKLNNRQAIIEPFMIIIIGAFVGFIIISVVMPMLNFMNSI